MGFWSRLFGKRHARLRERVVAATAAKLAGLIAEVRAARERGAEPVVVAHFDATAERVVRAFAEAGLTLQVIRNYGQFVATVGQGLRRHAAITLLMSEGIPEPDRRRGDHVSKDPARAPECRSLKRVDTCSSTTSGGAFSS
jgi:hypothetical protein